jgi:peptidoglycan/LPS O-acetylase OafA/YrhL
MSKGNIMKNTDNIHIDCLDGLRGTAATWVLVGHALILTNAKMFIIDKPDLAVDLFIILSGFLMAYNYYNRSDKEPWESPKTWFIFWVRRFFRIAPVYYLLLIIALLMGGMLFISRGEISNVWPATATANTRYTDNSLTNIFTHLTFIFGFIPSYSFRTPLPDWSIGLEMQYYLIFPFLMILWKKLNSVVAVIIGCLLCLTLKQLFPNVWHLFPMPSMIFTKLPLFFSGMLIAQAIKSSINKSIFLYLFALCVSIVPTWYINKLVVLTHVLFVSTIYFLTLPNDKLHASLKKVQIFSNVFFKAKFFRWLGNISYTVYLSHLLVLIPICGFIATNYGEGLNSYIRAAIAIFSTVIIIFPISWLFYETIEKFGITFGKKLINKVAKP